MAYSCRGFLVIIISVSLHQKRHQSIHEMRRELEVMDLCLFANRSLSHISYNNTVENSLFDGHDEAIQRHNAILLIKVCFAASLDAECNHFSDMFRQKRSFLERD